MGLSVNGVSIYPTFNNNAKYTPEKCETDSCNVHVGQGVGQPHYHGDWFGDQSSTWCAYGASN